MNGITLRADYGPYVVTAISPTQHFYTDTGLSSAVTLPATITSTKTWYCAPAYSDFYTFTCTQLDGSDISPGVPQWVGTTADSTLNPRPSWGQLAADVNPSDPWNPAYAISAGETTLPWWLCSSSSAVTHANQRLWCQKFTARRTESITKVAVTTGSGTANSITVVRIGIYSLNAAETTATLVASTANDATLLAAATTRYEKALEATWSKVAGTKYLIGFLVVGTGAPGVIGGVRGTFGGGALVPSKGWCFIGSQSDLPDPLTMAGTSEASATPFIELVP